MPWDKVLRPSLRRRDFRHDGRRQNHHPHFLPVDFTSREDKLHLLRQRSLGDAVLIGRSTLAHDNVRGSACPTRKCAPSAKRADNPPYPLRVIVSNEGRIDPALKIFQTDFSRIVIFSTTRMPRKFQKALREKATLRLSEARSVDLAWMLQQLRSEYGVRTVACEGGAELFRSLLELQLVDQLNLTIAPYIFGGKDAPTLTGPEHRIFCRRSVRCSLVEMRSRSARNVSPNTGQGVVSPITLA